MDLKIKDVAELLNVSEVTIRRWLADGKIPAYRLNHQYRFSRSEIENWVMQRGLKKQDPSEEELPTFSGQQQFSLYRAIHNGDLFTDITGKTKEEIIQKTMLRIANKLSLDADVLTELLLDREQLMPTALNHGIAVPHTRDFLLPRSFDLIVPVFLETPIEYGALDGEPVHTLFFLFASGDKRHLHLLAKLAHLSSQEPMRQLLKKRPSKMELLEEIRLFESKLQKEDPACSAC